MAGAPHSTPVPSSRGQLRLLHRHRIELAEQRLVVGLGQELLEQHLHDFVLGIGIRSGEDPLQHPAVARNLRLDGRPLDDDRGRQNLARTTSRTERQRQPRAVATT